MLSNISFDAAGGEWIVLVGPNGAGKSSLLDVLAGIASPTEGEMVDSHPGREGGLRRTYVPQSPERLLYAAPAAEEFAASLRLSAREVRANWDTAVAPRLHALGLGHLSPDDLPARLSTGMQRKFVYAMALAQPGDVLICDEPTSGLDASSRAQLLDEIAQFVAEGGLAITALHDLDEALLRATRVLAIARGRLVFDGTPQAFAQGAADLAQMGVPVPPSVRLALTLAQAGFPEPAPLSPKAFAERLMHAEQGSTSATKQAATREPGEARASTADADRRASGAQEPQRVAQGQSDAQGDETQGSSPAFAPSSELHPALRFIAITALTIAIALVHRPLGDLAALLVTAALVFSLRAPIRTTLRLTWTWASFAVIACAVSGLQLGPPFHARFAFHPMTAEHTLLEVVPYWCYLQMGQLALARFSSLQFAALVDTALARVVPRRQRLVASWFAALVTRFIPAVDVIYREQWYAYRVRLQNAGRKVGGWRTVMDVANVLAPFVIRMLRFGETTADAMEARRLFEVPPPAALLPAWRVKPRDVALLALAVVGIALLLWTR
ncbi:energy-coupling factor transport system ATP-binding protein [Alicyclobacillus vulcanalis]|uniref:Energy-coupling factor transport system ATP-binding protein n=1 Tax=Alicyclobacillus vulcanalis TaxID=252246 RepID=A0A1N7PNM0_9BACL|nr:energy-coupling factor transport system ATP-binding protein [Alicyclobacillus vulcanalis]